MLLHIDVDILYARWIYTTTLPCIAVQPFVLFEPRLWYMAPDGGIYGFNLNTS